MNGLDPRKSVYVTDPEATDHGPEVFDGWSNTELLVMRSHAVDLLRPTHTRCGLTGQHYQVFLSADPDPKVVDCPECRHAVNHQRLAAPPPLEQWKRSAPPYGLIGFSVFGISGFASFTFVFSQPASSLLALVTTTAILWWAREQDRRS